jgi:hypothetical protein
MGIIAEIDARTVEFKNFTFDNASSIFISETDKLTGMSLPVKTALSLDTSFEGKEFHVYFLSKKGLRENDVFQLFDQSQARRIGWCIPVNALDSVDHDYASNAHLQKYAYVGIRNALNKIDRGIFTRPLRIDGDSPIGISDILPESTALLVISQETLDVEFDIARWLPGLASLGYFQLTAIDPENISIDRPRVGSKEVKISPVAKAINNLDYLTSIYSHTLPFEKKLVFQFFHLYQVIELLMELVFKHEHASLVEGLISAKEDLSATKEILDKASENTSEKRRMGLLVQKYCCCQDASTDLVAACNMLLRQLGKPEGENLQTTLYTIRNFLFHQYRNFPATAEQTLEDVMPSLGLFLAMLLANFKYPASLKNSVNASTNTSA